MHKKRTVKRAWELAFVIRGLVLKTLLVLNCAVNLGKGKTAWKVEAVVHIKSG